MSMFIDFHRNERIWIDGIEWSVDRRTQTGILVLGVGDGFQKAFTTEELLLAFEEGRLMRTPREAALGPSQDLSAMSDKARETAVKRQNLIDEVILKLGPPPYNHIDLTKVLPDASAKAGFEKTVPLSTARRHLAAAKRCAGDIIGLAPNKAGSSGPRLPAAVELIIQEVIDEAIMTKPPLSGDEAHEAICDRIDAENAKARREAEKFGLEPTEPLRHPGKRTVYKRIEAQDDARRLHKQQSKAAADALYKKVQPGPVEDMPYGVIDIDHTRVDVIVVDDNGVPIGRPWLSVGIDRCTRMCAGFILTFEDPSAATVLLLIKAIVLGKGTFLANFPSIKNTWPCFGVPREAGSDNAVEFHARNYTDPLSELRIDPRYYPTANPAWKGGVERFFGTLNTGLFHMLPGTTLSTFNRKTKRDPATFATVTQQRLTEMIAMFIVDVYHQRPHRTLKVAPIKRWTEKTQEHPIRLPPSRRAVDLALLHRDSRTVRRQGIELHGLFYQDKSDDLRRLLIEGKGKAKAQVRWDPLDLGKIYVRDEKRVRFLEVESVLPEAKGMTVWQRKAILADLGANAGGATVGEIRQSRAKLRELAKSTLQEARKHRKKIGKTKQAARMLSAAPTHHGGAAKPASQAAAPLNAPKKPTPAQAPRPASDLDKIAAASGIRVRKGASK